MLLVINAQGQVRCLYSEMVDLAQLGSTAIHRASHVEPDSGGRWWADLAPSSGPKLGPFLRRSQALAMEQRWLEDCALDPFSSERKSMGLTIHYELQSHLPGEEDVRAGLERMRQAAIKLPFKEVSPLLKFAGDACAYGRDDEHRWFKIQSGQYFEHANRSLRVSPLHIIGFETWPGEGCEPANFGLCRYPAFADYEESPGRRRSVPTQLTGWRWGSFCKTQYASDPDCGGVENFVRCHLLVVQMLDLFAKVGWCEVTVKDESDYWEHRDAKQLAETVGEWNETIAAAVGQIKDAAQSVGMTSESPITSFPNFEHLEAKGVERRRKRD